MFKMQITTLLFTEAALIAWECQLLIMNVHLSTFPFPQDADHEETAAFHHVRQTRSHVPANRRTVQCIITPAPD